MTDKPILFSGPMVRALLEDRKTQTRRVINLKHDPGGVIFDGAGGQMDYVEPCDRPEKPKIKIGDRLWVREAWRTQEAFDDLSPKQIMAEFEEEWGAPSIPTFYEADHKCDDHSIELWQQSQPGRLRASMHMPRCASRITLIVTDVRVQRLQEISEADAIAEGVDRHKSGWMPYSTAFYDGDGVTPANYHVDPRISYMQLWGTINAKRGHPWEKNPWVAAYSFEVIKANIDEVPA